MRNCMVAVCLWILCSTLSAAQGKISSQWKCGAKPSDQHSIAVPDHAGHNYSVAQGRCAAEGGSVGDVKEQEGTYTEFDDVKPTSIKNRGVFVDTLVSGDTVFYHYHGTQILKDGKMVSAFNKWTLAGGTGKYKGVKGEGGCKGKGNADGSSSWHCGGSYSAAK